MYRPARTVRPLRFRLGKKDYYSENNIDDPVADSSSGIVKRRFIKAFVGYTGPELAIQEALYGFVMALIFITSASVGLISYDSPWSLVILIIGMNFVWGTIDMYIFYKMDVFAQARYVRIMEESKDERGMAEHYDEIYGELDGTIFDVLSEDDKNNAVKLVLTGRLETSEELKRDRKNMFMSAAVCFTITLITTIPIILCLLLIPAECGPLMWASATACICLFFVGFMLEPDDPTLKRLTTGASLTIISFALTFFATYLGG